MLKLRSYNFIGAWAILVVFLTGWSVGAIHHLFNHHEHQGPLECSANHDPQATHIHDESYANEHCSLCAFVLSTPELLSISPALNDHIDIPPSQDSFHCTPSCTQDAHDTTCLRGPPVM